MKFQINVYKPGKRPTVKIPREASSPTRLPLFIFVGMIVLILMGFAYLYTAQVGTLKRKMRADQKQIMMLRQFLTESNTGQNKIVGVEDLLLQVKGERVLWKDKLIELSRLIPDGIRLTQLNMEIVEKTPDRTRPRQKVKETILTMKGEMLSPPGQESLDQIARLIMKLNESAAFKSDFEPMELVYTHRAKTKDREFMEFELSGRLRPISTEG